MKVHVKCTGVMCGSVMIPQGIQDTESLGLADNDVKALIKRCSDISVHKDEKTSTKDEGSANAGSNDATGADAGNGAEANNGQANGAQDGAGNAQQNADKPTDPKAYDDITGQEIMDFLATKGVKHELTKAQKKELYPIYTGHFNDADVA